MALSHSLPSTASLLPVFLLPPSLRKELPFAIIISLTCFSYLLSGCPLLMLLWPLLSNSVVSFSHAHADPRIKELMLGSFSPRTSTSSALPNPPYHNCSPFEVHLVHLYPLSYLSWCPTLLHWPRRHNLYFGSRAVVGLLSIQQHSHLTSR